MARRRDRVRGHLTRIDGGEGPPADTERPEQEGPRAITAGPSEPVDAELVDDATDGQQEQTEEPTRVFVLAEGQPALRDSVPWPDETREWWAIWGQEDRSRFFTATDWQMLMDIALLHAAVWGSFDLTMVPRLNAAISKFGGTPLDRATLATKIAADQDAARAMLPGGAEGPAEQRPPSTRAEMRERLRSVGGRAG